MPRGDKDLAHWTCFMATRNPHSSNSFVSHIYGHGLYSNRRQEMQIALLRSDFMILRKCAYDDREY